MKKQLPAWAVLCIIALVAGLLLGATNELTASGIAAQALSAASASRRDALPEAEAFREEPLAENAGVTNCYAGLSGNDVVGYTAEVSVHGYGGVIKVVTGVSMEGVITGVSVGGEAFSETAGLGAKTKDPAFTEQFRNLTPPVAIHSNVDAITAATISSNAVIRGVNAAVDYILAAYLAPEAEAEEQPNPEGIDAWQKTDEGYIVEVSEFGFGGKIKAIVTIRDDGSIAHVEFEAPGETLGIGERIVSDAGFKDAFVEQSAPLSVDTLSGATISSSAAITAVEKALDFVANH